MLDVGLMSCRLRDMAPTRKSSSNLTKSTVRFNTTALLLARLRAGLTQEQLARKLDVTMRTVQHWEAGSGVPSGANLLPLAELLELSTSELYVVDEPDGVAA